MQLTRESTRAALWRLRPLSADAAFAFCRAGYRREAAAAMERGRAVLLPRALVLDSLAVDRLANDRAPRAARFCAAASRLTTLSARAGTAPW